MLKRIILGQIRHLLGAGGAGFSTWLISNGASVEEAEVIISGIIAIIGFAWSAYNQYKDSKKPTEPNPIILNKFKKAKGLIND